MKGWRTIIFNVASAVVPILSMTEWHGVMPENWLPYWVLFIALANIFLRSITNTPIGKSK